jgi:hypothetical protein
MGAAWGFARLGVVAVGLGIGASVAHSPVALADSDFQISFDGQDLFPEAGNSATATTVAGEYGLAIASGDGATAVAEGGTGDYALASGTNALAEAGSLTASSGNNYDAAYDIGNNTNEFADRPNGAFAGAGSLNGYADSGTNSHDTAIDIGNNTGYYDGAYAGDGNLFDVGTAGNGDTAYTYGNIDGFADYAVADAGNDNYASVSGDQTGPGISSFAGNGNDNTSIYDASSNEYASGSSAGDGDGNYAYVYGPANSYAEAIDGNNNIAYIDDPYGTAANPDTAIAGDFDNELAEVLFTHGSAVATTADYAYDIISLLGNASG